MSDSAQIKSPGPLGRFLALPNDSNVKTVGIALMVCLVCSLAVSTTVVGLKELRLDRQGADIRMAVLEAAGLLHPGADVNRLFDRIETRMVDLNTGEYADGIDPASYDQRTAVKDRKLSNPISRQHDIAGIKRRARYARVYLVRQDDQLKCLVLPVYGQGYLSTMYGFIAVKPDGNTVCGLKFYEEQETPGMGGEVEDPRWLVLWRGKRIYDDAGKVAIEVIHGKADEQSGREVYEVDGLSGATMTSKGITSILHFWLGDLGFKKYIEKHFINGEG